MNLDELQSIRDRERQSDSLQQLRESFYADAGEFVEKLRKERSAAADRADDPFDSPEVSRLSDDIKTAEQTVEAIYERRVGKLVKMASFAAADMPTEDEGLTAEERKLFEQLVASIEQNRNAVFDILDGKDVDVASMSAPTSPESTETTADAPPDAADEVPEGVDAADLMGSDAGDEPSSDRTPPSTPDAPPQDGPASDASSSESPAGSGPADADDQHHEVPPDDSPVPDDLRGQSGDDAPGTPTDTGSETEPEQDAEDPDVLGADAVAEREGTAQYDTGSSAESGAPDGDTVERATVRITQDVGDILGVDQREYDLSRDDVVTLPAENVEPLLQRDAAERLD